MVGVLADHAVGVGERVEEAAGWIVLPCKGRSDAFQIHPNNASLMAVVKMGVLHRACAEHQAVSVGTPQGIVFFLGAAFHGSKGSVLNHAAISIVGKFPGS
ncbi:hypothetical protein [Akkermansia sp.]|uniref:hypothetical protein n=1 Tax=Akkermansia sp. TaxID=1872421 RepID=UPI003993AB60